MRTTTNNIPTGTRCLIGTAIINGCC